MWTFTSHKFNRFVIAYLLFILLGCSSSNIEKTERQDRKNKADEKSYEEKIADAVDAATAYFNEKLLLFTDDQLVMSLHLLNDEFDLGMEFPHIGHFTSLSKKLKNNFFRLYDHYFLDQKEVEVHVVSEEEFSESISDFRQDKNLRKLAFLLCDQMNLPDQALVELKDMMAYDKKMYPEAIFNFLNIEHNGCFQEMSKNNDLLDSALKDLDGFLNNKDVDFDRSTINEALAMFAYAQKNEYLTKDRILDLIKNQNENGGWPADETNDYSVPYSSLMGYWTLLEVKRDLPPKPQLQ